MTSLEKIKLQANVWDSDKNSAGFASWAARFETLTSSLAHGVPLKQFLDCALEREPTQERMTPSWLLSDMFAYPEDLKMEAEAAAALKEKGGESDAMSASTIAQSSVRGTTSVPIAYPYKTYADLPEASRKLDGELYPLLQQVVTGSKATLLTHVPRPSYVLGMLVLYKHIDISASDRMMNAFNRMDKVKFSGDVHEYQIECVGAVQEMYDSQCTIEGYIMSRIMKSFKGSAKAVQMEIAKDLDENKVKQLNIYDMIQKYCSRLHTIGDGKPKEQFYTGQEEGKGKGKGRQKGKGKAKGRGKGGKGGRDNHKNEECARCGNAGHKTKDCYAKKHKDGSKLESNSNTNSANTSTPPPNEARDALLQMLKAKGVSMAAKHAPTTPISTVSPTGDGGANLAPPSHRYHHND